VGREDTSCSVVSANGRCPTGVDMSGIPAGSVHRNPFRSLLRRPYCGAMMTQVIVLNGGSSSGKSGIARCLQAVLPDPWLAFGVDTLIQAMPASMRTSDAGIEFAPDGEAAAATSRRGRPGSVCCTSSSGSRG
jgi:hypothetical protein